MAGYVSYKHFLALEKIVENNYKYAVIIEDNVGKIKKNIIETLHECLKQLPKIGMLFLTLLEHIPLNLSRKERCQ